ncbi:MAG: HD domain-containing protein [Phycisphaerae bacterium]|nr:HD domain-containing protein [Phycisphaerae bacterium]
MIVPAHLRPSDRGSSLADEVRALGGLWLACDRRGAVVDIGAAGPDDLVATLFARSRPFQQLLATEIARSAADPAQHELELVPGLFAIVSRVPGDRSGSVGVALLPTAAFAYGSDLERFASAAAFDVGALRARLLERDLPEPREIARLAPLLRFGHRADAERDAEIASGDAVGWQLAESYEEINLLYTLVSGMRASDNATHFVQLACDELVRSLGFSWVAVHLNAGASGTAAPEASMASGSVPFDRERISELAGRIVLAGSSESPRVFPRGSEVTGELVGDAAVVACPIRRDRRVVGHLFTGERRNRSGEISSIDLKLADATAGHVAIHVENARLYRDLDRMFMGTLEAIVNAIDAKDPYTRGHSQRVAILSRDLARAIGVPEPTLRNVHIAGLIHDVGKIGVPEAVLRKTGKLTDEEFGQIRLHPEIGWRILRDIPQFSEMLDGVLSHHERWDGRGYPNRLSGESIPLVARIIALADAFDAMSSNRTYRSRRPRAVVLEEIRKCSGEQFDPTLVEPFLRLDFTEYDKVHVEHERLAMQTAVAAVIRRVA